MHHHKRQMLLQTSVNRNLNEKPWPLGIGSNVNSQRLLFLVRYIQMIMLLTMTILSIGDQKARR